MGENLRIAMNCLCHFGKTRPMGNNKSSSTASSASMRKKVVTVLYGSQTGTAETFAKMLVTQGRQHQVEVQAINLKRFNPATLPNHSHVIFVVATYGEGGPTDSSSKFHKFMTSAKLSDHYYRQIQYTVFGLGNKKYRSTYNAMGRAVDAFMEKHGAHRVYRRGEGDDRACIEDDFDQWRNGGLWDAFATVDMATRLTLSSSMTQSMSKTRPPLMYYEIVPALKSVIPTQPLHPSRIDPNSDFFFNHKTAVVVGARELRRSTASGSTLFLELDIRDSGVSYVTADNLAILPENDPALVTRVAKALRYDATAMVDLKPVEGAPNRSPFPTPCSIETILSRYLDLNSAPRKSALSFLAHYATAAPDHEKLLYLASTDGKAEYKRWIQDACRTFADVIEAFPSLEIPLAAFLHIVPTLQSRYYTISSSSQVHPTRIQLTFAVIQASIENGRRFHGVASNYLARIAHEWLEETPEEEFAPVVRMYLRNSLFKLPVRPETPVIMVGPGTGIAPMRAFLQERQAQKQAGEPVGPTWFFFGCRHKTQDYLYEDELASYKANGTLTELHVAFSRDTAEKVYVQHHICQRGAALWELLAAGAHVYVCGGTLMGNDVQKAFVELVQFHGGKSPLDASHFVRELQRSYRYVQELWT
ncbi:hypothetical protein Ae201684P_011492 [Aphanomyces euteiches]|uniref:NADPH--hemoprotein reductase n=1 Tax=Aphanomyces euteiches TaxID=100861 RepID=A0A6G0XW86_9STRA|nr:hypothetical protein Ae201684_000553 [Aphanomyces euteiches]KAH9091951.1 hypothetical protein Ae201684P_011492 [Aphanomyces euteiches]KAH9151975.1 hypothetical protein AeRB84_005536 [Aphanomyces euteiches]